jgi:hypothetical protein
MKNYLDQEMTGILNKIKGFKEEEGKGESKKEEEGEKDQGQEEGEEDDEFYIDEEGRKRKKTKTRTTVSRSITSTVKVIKKKGEDSGEEEPKPEENKRKSEALEFKGLGSGGEESPTDKTRKTRTKTTVTKTKTTSRKTYGGRLIGTNPEREVSPEMEDLGSGMESLDKLKNDHLLSKVTDDQGPDSEGKPKEVEEIEEEERDHVEQLDPKRKSTKKEIRKVSILRKKNKSIKARKSVRFSMREVEQEEMDVNEEFIRKVPTGTILLTNEQRDMLIEVLEEPDNEEDDLILSLEPGQVKEVVKENFSGDNATVVVDLAEKRNVTNSKNSRVSIYPRNFFAMVEKQRLKGSRLSVYPENFFDNIEKGVARRDPSRKPERVSMYPKDLFELVDEEMDAGRISTYPQEMYDLFRECKDEDSAPGVRKKAKTIYPGEFLNLVDKQTERGTRKRQRTVYPKELFEMAEQEKINGERVSVYPRELFSMLSKQAKKERASVYPKDLFDLLDTEYSNVIKLTPMQSESLVKKNLNEDTTHIVLSEDQRKDLLGKLKKHKKEEEEKGNDETDLLEVDLEKDQVLDILHQNCMTEGTEIKLTPKQKEDLVEVRKIRPTVIGNEYYDVLVDQLVNDKGDRLELNRVEGLKRRSLLDQVGPKKVSVIEVNEDENPEVLSKTHYDTKQDEIVSRKTRKSVLKLGENEESRKSRISNFTRKSMMNARRTSLLGQVYYDAMVNELVDETGNRHSLDDKTPKEISEILKDKEVEKVPVLVEDEGGKDDALILKQVEYMPGKDCLVDEKGRKTGLNDLSNTERQSLMKILGERRGTKVSGGTGSVYTSKDHTEPVGKKARFGSGNKPMTFVDRERDLEKIRQRKKTGHPGNLLKKKKKLETDKLKEDILHGETSPENRGSMVYNKKRSPGRMNRANTMHPKDRTSPDIELVPETSPERSGSRGKNIQGKRMTVYGSPRRANYSKRKTMGSKSPERISSEEFKRMGEMERERRRKQKEEEEAEKLRLELEKKKRRELERAKKKKEEEERLERERKRLEDLRLANERKRLQQLKIAQEKKRIEAERMEKHRKKNEELRRLSDLRKKQKAEELNKRNTIKDLKTGKGKKTTKRNTLGGKGRKSGVRGKATTMHVKDKKYPLQETEEFEDIGELSETVEESVKKPSRKSTATRKSGRKTISNIHDQYYAGNNMNPGKRVVSEGMNLMGGQESPRSETSQEKRKKKMERQRQKQKELEDQRRREQEEEERRKKLEEEEALKKKQESINKDTKSKLFLTILYCCNKII